MSDTDKKKSAPAPAPPAGTYHINNCPHLLWDRAKAKAALKRKDVSEWIIQVLTRETKDLEEIQVKYRAEDRDK